MKKTMLAGVYTGKDLELQEAPIPTLDNHLSCPKKYKQGELLSINKNQLVLLNVEATSICGTDLEIVKNPPGHDATRGAILGHEYIGVVEETGKEVTNVSVGDRVAVDPNIKCGVCWFCKNDKASLCRDMTTLGIFAHGGFASYNVAPAMQLHKIPHDMPLERAIFFEPLTCVTHAWEKIGGIEIGDSVLIFGAGPVGCYFVEMARLSGAGCIIVAEPSGFRRNFAEKLGAHIVVNPAREDLSKIVREATHINEKVFGVGVAVDACGNPDVVKIAINLVRPGGVISTFGEQDVRATADKVSFTKVTQKELTIVGSYATTRSFDQTIKILENPELRLPQLVTHTIPLSQIQTAYDAMRSGDGVEIIIIPEHA